MQFLDLLRRQTRLLSIKFQHLRQISEDRMVKFKSIGTNFREDFIDKLSLALFISREVELVRQGEFLEKARQVLCQRNKAVLELKFSLKTYKAFLGVIDFPVVNDRVSQGFYLDAGFAPIP